MRSLRCSSIVLLCLFSGTAFAAAPAKPAAGSLKSGDRVAICGDSITEQKMYSVYIEDYLLMCQPVSKLRPMQFGWSGDTTSWFLSRMKNDFTWFAPTVATTCYGMNDGGYSPMTTDKADFYRKNMTAVVENMKQNGVRFIVVGSSGAVDSDAFAKSPEKATMYNKTLGELRGIAQQVAADEHVAFADVYTPMIDVMAKAKAKYGHDYNLAGGDGVHPNSNGHLVMAYAFLKALGCDGNIGAITVNLRSGKASATAGHKVLSSKKGTVEIESSKYPFCFFGAQPEQPSSTRGVLEFLPFNRELNRFMLIAKGGKAARYTVKWGDVSHEYTKEDLAKGINLAAEFLDNPFCAAFADVNTAVQQQQNLETTLVKTWINNHMAAETEQGKKQDDDLVAAAVAAVKPVKYVITIQPVAVP